MPPLSLACAGALVLALAGCAPAADEAPEPDGSWRGSIEVVDGVTRVVNESGSLWDGPARLVEEASIGVESGPDEAMFGFIESVYATEDRIYVVDSQVPAVRIYDHEGNYLGDLGRGGEGPGEYTWPGMIAVGPAGRIFLLAARNNRILVYAPDGSFLESWPSQNPGVSADGPMRFSDDGVMWMRVTEYPTDDPTRRHAIQAHGPDGLFGPRWRVERDDDPELPTLSVRGRRIPVPLAPSLVWTGPVAPATLVVGTSDLYRFDVRREGRTVKVIERSWEPDPIDPEWRDWTRRMTVASMRRPQPDWQWNGPEIPEFLPAFSGFFSAASGELWVRRPLPAERRPDCVEDPVEVGVSAARQAPCWEERWATDVFGADGRYLGEVEVPPNVRMIPSHLFVRDRLVVAAVVDEAGTPMVKRYRLVAETSSQALSLDQLENAEYGEVTLTDGVHEEELLRIELTDQHAFGDLDADGRADAVVLLLTTSEGSAGMVSLVAFRNDGGTPQYLDTAYLGDRVGVERLSVRDGSIIVVTLEHGPADARCCPTQELRRTFALQEGRLVERR